MLAWLLEHVLTRRLRLPPATTRYRVTTDLPVPMRDGIVTLADHYMPLTAKPAGTLLLRGPYGRHSPQARVTAGLYACRGYHVVVVSTRGTFGSGGDYDPGRTEIPDGIDTVGWLRAQNWFTGTFSTVGGSFLGFTQWALLTDPPPELDTSVISMAPHDFGRAVWGTGSFTLADILSWAYLTDRQEIGGWVRQLARSTLSPRRLRLVMGRLPLAESTRAVLGEGSRWYSSWLEHADPDDDYWAPLRLDAAFDRVRRPVLLTGGWQDVFVDQALDQFRELRARGADVSLVVGPWTHGDGGGAQTRETIEWLSGRRHPTPVRVFVTGADQWRDLADWPPEATDRVLYPTARRALDGAPPDPADSQFVFDPADPTPTIGGRLLAMRAAGYRDDTALASRADVLVFTGDVLREDLDVIGQPRVHLDHTTDIPWADLFVRISEVDAKGRSHNVSDGYLRLQPDRATTPWITMDPIAHRFRGGRRIRMLIAGGCFPHYARNLGTGEPPATGSAMVRCMHTVTHGETTRLVLPVVATAT